MCCLTSGCRFESTDRKAIKKTRDRDARDLPQWLSEFRKRMPEELNNVEIEESQKPNNIYSIKEEKLKESEDAYERLAWIVFAKITSTAWFEGFIAVNIILIGVSVGIDLQYRGECQCQFQHPD